MRHRVKGRKLGRDAEHRKSLLKNLSEALVTHGKIETTLAKAKYLRPYVERLITRAKKGDNYETIRYLKRKINSKKAIKHLVSTIAPAHKDRPGGYTRIIKLPERSGDNAPMARIELVENAK